MITQFHADGVANDHPSVLLAGLFALFFILDVEDGPAMWTGRFAAGLTAVTLALYGLVMAVNGVALKQAVNSWVSSPDTEKAARFASAEAIRWIERGARSYEDFTLRVTWTGPLR